LPVCLCVAYDSQYKHELLPRVALASCLCYGNGLCLLWGGKCTCE